MAYGAIPGDDGTTGAAEAPQQRCKVAVAILLCLLTISVVPLANKAVLKRGANGAPLAMTACQLFGAALLFGLCHVLHSAATGSLARPTRAELRRKAKNIGPLGVAFGLKLGVTNVGLSLVSVELHVLLMATDIFWTTALRAANQPRGAQSSGGARALWVLRRRVPGLHQRHRRRRAGRRAALRHCFKFDRTRLPGYCGGASKEIRHARDRRREYVVRRVYVPQALLQCPRRVPGGASVRGRRRGRGGPSRDGALRYFDAPRQRRPAVVHRAGDADVQYEAWRRGHVQGRPQWLLAFVANGTSLSPQHLAAHHLQHLVGVVLVTLSALLWAYSGGATARRDTAARVLAEVFDAATPPGSPSRATSPHSPAILRLGSF